MGQLLVRNIDDAVVRALKERAVRNGRSAEAEHREILREALLSKHGARSLKDLILQMPDVGDDADFLRPADRGREIEL